jgi:hypothetical protein
MEWLVLRVFGNQDADRHAFLQHVPFDDDFAVDHFPHDLNHALLTSSDTCV